MRYVERADECAEFTTFLCVEKGDDMYAVSVCVHLHKKCKTQIQMVTSSEREGMGNR